MAKREARTRRHARVRKRVRGTTERPRLAVYRSNVAIYAQVIDDTRGHTLAAASSLEKDLPAPDSGGEQDDSGQGGTGQGATGQEGTGGGKVSAARAVGALVARRAVEAGVQAVVFDRGGNRYTGRVAALAEGARSGGLTF
jgi:large subunit ribosomal protein L18